MVDEKDLDTIEKAHLAAERLEKANKEKEELIKRMEEVDKRIQGRQLLSGESYAGAPPKPEMSQEEKVAIATKTYWKGSALERYFT